MDNNNAEGDPGRMFMRCASLSSLDESSQVAAREETTCGDSSNNHAQLLLTELAALRRDATLCDVVLIAGDEVGPDGLWLHGHRPDGHRFDEARPDPPRLDIQRPNTLRLDEPRLDCLRTEPIQDINPQDGVGQDVAKCVDVDIKTEDLKNVEITEEEISEGVQNINIGAGDAVSGTSEEILQGESSQETTGLTTENISPPATSPEIPQAKPEDVSTAEANVPGPSSQTEGSSLSVSQNSKESSVSVSQNSINMPSTSFDIPVNIPVIKQDIPDAKLEIAAATSSNIPDNNTNTNNLSNITFDNLFRDTHNASAEYHKIHNDNNAYCGGNNGGLGARRKSPARHGVPAHRAVLAAGSQYFRAMFTQFDERTMHTITIMNVEHRALEAIVEYIYNPDSLMINEDNVQALMQAGTLLGVAGVRAACGTFLARALAPDNVLGVRALADLLAARDLLASADAFLDAHAPQVLRGEEWVQAPAAAACAVLARDSLRLGPRGELEALDAALRWLQHEPARAPLLATLLQHVRLPLLPREELARRAFLPPLHNADIQVKDLLIEALSWGAGPTPSPPSPRAARRRRPRAHTPPQQVLLVVGGQAPKAIGEVEALPLCGGGGGGAARWAAWPALPGRRCRAGLALREGRVWAVGGFNGVLRVRGVEVLTPGEGWAPGPPLLARRSTLGVCQAEGALFAVGGFDGCVGLASAETLPRGASAWRPLPPMRTRRSSVAVAHLNRHVYAVGGYDGMSRQCLSSVEAYSLELGAWVAAPAMAERRSGAAVAELQGKLYAVGGHDGPAVRRSAEVFTPGADGSPAGGSWAPARGMRRARRNAAAAVHAGKLYVVGGDDGYTSLDTVEVFDPALGSWQELDTRMSVGRSYAGACVLPPAPHHDK